MTNEELDFLAESNAIEGVYSSDGLVDAIKAWQYMKQVQIVTLSDILKVHELLLHRLRSDISGQWRRCAVRIGGQLKPFISAQFVEEQLRPVIAKLNNLDGTHEPMGDDMRTRQAHIDFEDVHPFEDGNGRVGRILYNWHRMQLNLPIHVIHVGKEQLEYYDWFKK